MTSKFPTLIRNFLRDDSGAVTVDWVVLTASVVFLALVVIAIIAPGVNGLSTKVATGVNNVPIGPGGN